MINNVPRIIQPRDIKIPLYQHQLVSIYQMEKREEIKQIEEEYVTVDTNISINADTTGYGKTISMITLVYRDKMEWDLSIPYIQSSITSCCNGRIKKTKSREYNKLDVTLVLVPQSIINQWYEECKKTPLSVKMVTTKKLVDTTMVENYDIILVTPLVYNKIVHKYSDMAWKRFIFDEPGHMKVSAMTNIVAGFIWFVTATPDLMTPMHKKCKSSFMYDFVSQAGWGPLSIHFKYMTIKNNDTFINESFTMPQTHHLYYKCHNPIYNTVQNFVTPNIKEMISAGNIQDAITALGGGKTKNITELIKKKKLEEIEILKSNIKILKIRNKNKKIKDVEIKIEHINNQIKELDNKFTEMLESDCPICFSNISNPVIEPNCQNIFCGNCILTWLQTKSTCPLCRHDIQPNELIYIGKKQSSVKKQSEIKTKTKISTVIDIIQEKPDGQFIIFSSWDKTFEPIRNQLNNYDIKFIEIKGSIEQRKNNINKFKNGEVSVIFLNSKNNGYGINLQEATDIIIYHEMSTNSLNQLIGRANRLGREKQLIVHHLQL